MKRVLLAIMFPVILLSFSHLTAGQAKPGSLDDRLNPSRQNGDIAAVQRALGQGANIEAKGPLGDTALIVAASYDKVDVVGLLLQRGAKIEARGDSSFTALIDAASSGNADVVKLLLQKGANIEAADMMGETALIEAALIGGLTL